MLAGREASVAPRALAPLSKLTPMFLIYSRLIDTSVSKTIIKHLTEYQPVRIQDRNLMINLLYQVSCHPHLEEGMSHLFGTAFCPEYMSGYLAYQPLLGLLFDMYRKL